MRHGLCPVLAIGDSGAVILLQSGDVRHDCRLDLTLGERASRGHHCRNGESRGTRLTPVVTNPDGDFVLPNLPADTYTVEVTMPGFKALRREHVPVSGGARVTLGALAIEVGGTAETVNVTAEHALIQAQTGERSFTITPVEVQSLPIAGRNFASLTALSPGADGTARIGGGGMNNIMMDGVSVMDTGSNAQMLNLNPESIAEARYAAEYPGEWASSGLQLQPVTKSGTNRFRGQSTT
jgi:hypothetical protein